MSNSTSAKKFYLTLALFVLIILVILLVAAHVTRITTTDELRQQGSDSLAVYASNLSSELDKYRDIPVLLASYPLFAQSLLEPENLELARKVNERLLDFNKVYNALDTYILDIHGMTVSASNWQSETSFIGEDLSFRPYFTEAINSGIGYYFALGNTSLKRGYYFSAAIYTPGYEPDNFDIIDLDKVIGVLVVKITLDQMEKAWSQVHQIVAVTDEDGVIFISSRQDWVYRAIQEIPERRLQEIKLSRRYADQPLTPLAFRVQQSDQQDTRLLSLSGGTERSSSTLLHQSKSVPEKGWVIHIFSDYNIVSEQVNMSAVAAASVTALVLALLSIFYIRRQARVKEEQIKHNSYISMQQQVKERTEELTAAQDGLIQAAKMAALGQMATSISHELSQPLSAIRNFAENAREFLKRGDVPNASTNLGMIENMGERMTSIMQNLKTFARKTSFQLEAVSLDLVIQETLQLMSPVIKKSEADIHYEPIASAILVRAEPVRLQQVFTNLIQNALDALEDTLDKNIVISVKLSTESAVVSVADSGTGIADDFREKLFEPFSTTKEAGKGLGLGLSLSYGIVQEFGGSITAVSQEQGSVFKVELKRVRANVGAPA